MTNFILALALCAAVVSATYTFDEYVKAYSKPWKKDHKEYSSREAIFNKAVAKIDAHNRLYEQGKTSYKMGVNSMSAMEPKEYKTKFGFDKKMLQHGPSLGEKLKKEGIDVKPVSQLPTSVDWREKNIVSAVKDQGHCGSCWAFSTTAVLESYVAKESGLLFNLSPQQLASCAPNPDKCGGSGGCEGATYDVSFGYASSITADGGGLYEEYQYAYNSYYGEDFECKTIKDTEPVAGIDGWITLVSNNYTQLMNAVAQSGPVAVVVDASDWSSYTEGVFDGCNTESPDINHGVVVVGYGVCEKHGPYW